MKKNASFGRHLSDWLPNGLVLSKTLPFILGLITSHALIQNAVVDVMVDFLTDKDEHHQSHWKAAIFTNLVDMISEVLKVAIAHVSDTYTGPFTVISFCTTAYAMGLMLLGVRGMLIFAIVLIALGKAGKEPTSEFFYNQLMREKLSRKRTEEKEHRSGFLWHFLASYAGKAIGVFWLGNCKPWRTRFKISSLVMETTSLLFFSGIFFYYSEQTINSEESSSKNSSDVESEERVEAVRTEEEQVRDVKSLYPPIILLGFTFIPYSLVLNCGDTYFVAQTNMLDSSVGGFDVSVIVFFVLQSSVASVVRLIQSRCQLMEPVWSMAVGIFCSALCASLVLLVESGGNVSLGIWVLTPQYLLQGIMEGFAEFGLASFLHNQLVAELMRRYVYPWVPILFGIRRFFSILFALIVVRRNPLDRCFLILATLSFVSFLIYLCLARLVFARFQGKGVLEGAARSNESRLDSRPSQQENGEAASRVNQVQIQLERSKTIKRKTSQLMQLEELV